MVMSNKTAIFQKVSRIMTLFFFNLLGDYCNPQHRVTSIATAFGPPNFQMEITPLYWAWYWLSGRTYILYIVTNIQAHARKYNFHLTYLKEARSAHQLSDFSYRIFLLGGEETFW